MQFVKIRYVLFNSVRYKNEFMIKELYQSQFNEIIKIRINIPVFLFKSIVISCVIFPKNLNFPDKICINVRKFYKLYRKIITLYTVYSQRKYTSRFKYIIKEVILLYRVLSKSVPSICKNLIDCGIIIVIEFRIHDYMICIQQKYVQSFKR